MLHKFKPDLTLYLAEEALKQKFCKKEGLQEIMDIQKECRDYLSTENIRRIYARMMKKEVTKMMVDAVYATLSAEEQELINLKYRDKKQMVAISLKLNISLAQLNIRHHIILEKTAEFMQYKLNEKDIFERDKIEQMVLLLRRIMDFAELYDPTRKFISEYWLAAITERHDKYESLLIKLDKILNFDANALYLKIIAEKVKNPHIKIRELSKICNADKSIVSRDLKHFVDNARQYIE